MGLPVSARDFMEFKDYYKTLGVERSATADEIKRAYRKLARKFHPDVNKDPTAEAQFKEVGEANEVLSDVEKRAAYDQLGRDWKPGQEFQPPPNWDADFEFSGAASQGAGAESSDFFDTLFGSMRGRDHPFRDQGEFHARGEDHHAKILIALSDSFTGATRTISLRIPEIDKGGHVVLRNRTLDIQIPKGVIGGQQIRLKGQGGPGTGRLPAGDLYLEVQFNSDPLYRAAGRDLYLDLPVAPWEAALGASVKVPTPAGTIMLKIPSRSTHGRELRIKGRGIPAAQPGDLYAVLKVVLPPADTENAIKFYEQMARDLPFDPRAKFGA
jgi:curved DNA-binding protein